MLQFHVLECEFWKKIQFNYNKVDDTVDKRNSILYDDFKCAPLLGKQIYYRHI